MTGETESGARMSALCRSVEKDGWDLDMVIHEDGEGLWLLEVRSGADCSTCWFEAFETEEEALAEALRAIDESDIEEFRMPAPWRDD